MRDEYDFSDGLENTHAILSHINIVVTPDDDAYHASCREIPQLYGAGDTPEEAAAMLRREIISLRNDLLESNNFPPEFLAIKKWFAETGGKSL